MNIKLDHLYSHKNVDLNLNDVLTVFTGNNGSGKTTILNMFYNIINGNFSSLFNLDFNNLELSIDESDFKPHQENHYPNLITNIEVIRFEQDRFNINYYLQDGTLYRFSLENVNHPHFDDKAQVEEVPDYYIDEFNETRENFFLYDNVEELIECFSELHESFSALKSSILYFPTYRRIDSDLLDLLEQNHTKKRLEGDFNTIKKIFDSLPTNNKIVGINNDDIDEIFKKYSFDLQSINTEGLNFVLKNIINQLIESTYSYTNESANQLERYNMNKNSSIETLQEAPDTLIQLAQQLQLTNVNKESINEYFKIQEKYNSPSFENINNNKRKQKNSSSKRINSDFEKMLFSLNGNNDLILKLISSYSSHLKTLEKFKQPYEYLVNNFEKFFKNKIMLEMNPKNYKINLSKSFKEMSTGEKQILTILCYSALFNTDYYRPIIIIDEPELSLHMSWQLKLLPSLLELPNNAKLIISTHSPYIAYDEYIDYIFEVGETDD